MQDLLAKRYVDDFLTPFAYTESDNASDADIHPKFLTDLLSKFKKTMGSTHNKSSSFAKEVAVGLTQSLEARDEYLKTECPVCLDEPKITDAVHTPCAHMFCMVSGAVVVYMIHF